MTFTTEPVEILKQDAQGRVRVSVERREALLDEFERSAVSAARFARLCGIKYPTFANWVARRRRERAARQAAPGMAEDKGAQGRGGAVRFFEAVVGDGRDGLVLGSAADGLVIELPGGSRVLVGSPVQLPLVVELVALVAQRMSARC